LSAVADKQKNATKAAAKVRAAQQQKRQRMQWSIGIIVLVVVGVVVLVLAKMSTNNTKASSDLGRHDAPASVAADLAKVPLPLITKAFKARSGSDASYKAPAAVNEKPLTAQGKPRVLYMGAEYCPFCGAERWALTVALSKFGTFSDLKIVHSMSNDNPADVPTLSFYGAKYTSKYLTFSPIELEDREGKPLEKPSAADQKLLVDHGRSYPFIDFGGRFIQSGASLDANVLLGKKQVDIAKSITASGDISSISGQVNSAAGGFIKAICALTDGQPGNVCKAFPAA
jgi:hypothetical protein